jgi:hypothetical protein
MKIDRGEAEAAERHGGQPGVKDWLDDFSGAGVYGLDKNTGWKSTPLPK